MPFTIRQNQQTQQYELLQGDRVVLIAPDTDPLTDYQHGWEDAAEAVAQMLHEEGWLKRLDADTMTRVLERLHGTEA